MPFNRRVVTGPSLTTIGVLWVGLSLLAAVLNSAGFYLPYWIKGVLFNSTEVSFGSFRRCNYPRLSPQGKVEVVLECGRYTGFQDIPSRSWQVATVLVGLGASLSLLVAFTGLSACCLADVVTRWTARVLGGIQFTAAVLVTSGCAVYPQGWGTREVKEACGGASRAYTLGDCKVSWCMYTLSLGTVLLLVCLALSFKASRIEPHTYRI